MSEHFLKPESLGTNVKVKSDLSYYLSNVVKNDVVKTTEYDELVKNVTNINTTDTSNLVEKTGYNTKLNEIEKKITDHDHARYIPTQ